MSIPMKKSALGARADRAFSFGLIAYAGLRFHCTTPPESSVRQCVPAHPLASTLRQTHAVARRYLYHRTRRRDLSILLRRQPQFSVQNAAENQRPKGAKTQAPLVVQPRRKACSPEAPAPWPGFGGGPNQRIGISEKDIPIHCWPMLLECSYNLLQKEKNVRL